MSFLDSCPVPMYKLIPTCRLKSYELDSTEDISLQRHIWTLHVGLVGALSFQHFGDRVDVVCILQWVTVRNGLLQKASNMKLPEHLYALVIAAVGLFIFVYCGSSVLSTQ